MTISESNVRHKVHTYKRVKFWTYILKYPFIFKPAMVKLDEKLY